MKIKKFIASSMPEAMNKIRKELGPNAVILHSKEIHEGGFLGLFKKRKIEVIAALDPDPIPTHSVKKKLPLHKENKTKDMQLLNELNDLKKMIAKQSHNQAIIFPTDYQIMYQYLLSQEVADIHAREIINDVMRLHGPGSILPAMDNIIHDTKQEIEKRLSKLSFQGITYGKQIVHFVGPTGVGKTTSIAKVAAKSMIKDHKRIAFITTDTYRIAAIEQLKTYAKILDVPIEVAYSLDDYKRAIQKFSDYDLILVDTAGRNFRDEKYVCELKNSIQVSKNIEIYLVLSLTAKQNDLREVAKQFEHIPVKEFIFTKLDETRQYGSMLSLPIENEIGIAYITNGQAVPDDLLQPTTKKISDLIVRDFNNG